MGLKLMSAAAIFFSLACAQSVNAASGCGYGFHRTPSGNCVMNPGVTVHPVEIYRPIVARPSTGSSAGPSSCSRGARWNGVQCVVR